MFIVVILSNYILFSLGLFSEMLLHNISYVGEDNEQNEVDECEPCFS